MYWTIYRPHVVSDHKNAQPDYRLVLVTTSNDKVLQNQGRKYSGSDAMFNKHNIFGYNKVVYYMNQWIQLKISKIVEKITKISIEGTSIKCLHQSIVLYISHDTAYIHYSNTCTLIHQNLTM